MFGIIIKGLEIAILCLFGIGFFFITGLLISDFKCDIRAAWLSGDIPDILGIIILIGALICMGLFLVFFGVSLL